VKYLKNTLSYKLDFLMLCCLTPTLYAQTSPSKIVDPNAFYRLTTGWLGSQMWSIMVLIIKFNWLKWVITTVNIGSFLGYRG
jgi:hypothetical protein